MNNTIMQAQTSNKQINYFGKLYIYDAHSTAPLIEENQNKAPASNSNNNNKIATTSRQ